MSQTETAVCFGPVPSRRLGRSIGVNNIPPKSCSYSCVYCQVGSTQGTECATRVFLSPDLIFEAVKRQLSLARQGGEPVDYVTFVADGEPTLDANLGEAIRRIKGLGAPVAVISNGSLVTLKSVRDALSRADWVSLKIDAVEENLWKRISIPHRSLDLGDILEHMEVFSRGYRGTLATETMLVDGLNHREDHAAALAKRLKRINPQRAYLSVPTRPPAVGWAAPPSPEAINAVYQIVSREISGVELLTGYEGSSFSSTGIPGDDILAITAVHPMREDAVRALLDKAGADWGVVDSMLTAGSLSRSEYRGEIFYMRTPLGRPHRNSDVADLENGL